MKTITYLTLIISTLILTACKGIPIGTSSDNNDEILYINNHKEECDAFSLSLCLQTRNSTNDEWVLFDATINGFTYQWGHDYKLEIEVEDITNPPQDGPSKKYTWVKTISDTTENQEAFEISVSRNLISSLIKKVSDDTYKIYNDKILKCLPDDCAKIDSIISDDRGVLFEFKHNDNPSEPLDLQKIVCDKPRAIFDKTKANGGCF
ncbi:MAG TPA: DUF4377 domain-containing protein [Leucothrix sp.]|nr:DUF4377 domain-containing protein [Leucothrix sp.]